MSPHPIVFLSSTYDDLRKHRAAVLSVLQRLKFHVTAMEHFGARNGLAVDECISEVTDADFYVGIIGMRYGFECKDGKSVTEKEYKAAIENKIPVLIYMLDEDAHPILPKHVDIGEKAEKLRALKTMLRDHHTIATFSSPEHLALLVGTDLVHLYMSRTVRDVISDGIKRQDSIPRVIGEGIFYAGLVPATIDLSESVKKQKKTEASASDRIFASALTGLYLGHRLSLGDINALKGFLTFASETWSALIYYCRTYGIDEESLSDAILSTTDIDLLRLLVAIAGDLKLVSCVDVICRAAKGVNNKSHYVHTGKYSYQARPFFEIVREALSKMPRGAMATLEQHAGDAKRRRQWRAYRAINEALRDLKS